jgi:hypothetical protein
MPHLVTRHADAKGRITLGPGFANKAVIIEERGDELILRAARVIPEDEAWVYENDKALSALRSGLQQARQRSFVKGPDLNAAKRLADQLAED